MRYALSEENWPMEEEFERGVLRCGNMLRPNHAFNPAWFPMDALEVIFECDEEEGEGGPYAALGYWYTHVFQVMPRPPHRCYTFSVWEPFGKEVEEMLGLRCLEHEGRYYFFRPLS